MNVIFKSSFGDDNYYEYQYTSYTLRDLLAEIKEFTAHDNFQWKNDYGNRNVTVCGAWSIKVYYRGAEYIFLSCWVGEEKISNVPEALFSMPVEKVTGFGGWYCGIDFKVYLRDF